MKKLVLGLGLLLLNGCSAIEAEQYRKALEAAERASLVDKKLGFGFDVDTPRGNAETKKESMRGTVQMAVPLSEDDVLTTQSIDLDYARDTLSGLQMRFKPSTPEQYTAFKELLTKKYGKPGLPHTSSAILGEQTSWFHGPIEIETDYDDLLGIKLEYRDLRRYQQHLKEFMDDYNREQAQKTAAQDSATSKL